MLQLTNRVSWRPEGIKHRKNEIFLDVVERLNLLVSSSGSVLHSEIVGAIKMKSFLSGALLTDGLCWRGSASRGCVPQLCRASHCRWWCVQACLSSSWGSTTRCCSRQQDGVSCPPVAPGATTHDVATRSLARAVGCPRNVQGVRARQWRWKTSSFTSVCA